MDPHATAITATQASKATLTLTAEDVIQYIFGFIRGTIECESANGKKLPIRLRELLCTPANIGYLVSNAANPEAVRAIKVRIEDGKVVFCDANCRADKGFTVPQTVTMCEDGSWLIPMNFSACAETPVENIEWDTNPYVSACLIFTIGMNIGVYEKFISFMPLFLKHLSGVTDPEELDIMRAFCAHVVWAHSNSWSIGDDEVAKATCGGEADLKKYEDCIESTECFIKMLEKYTLFYRQSKTEAQAEVTDDATPAQAEAKAKAVLICKNFATDLEQFNQAEAAFTAAM